MQCANCSSCIQHVWLRICEVLAHTYTLFLQLLLIITVKSYSSTKFVPAGVVTQVIGAVVDVQVCSNLCAVCM